MNLIEKNVRELMKQYTDGGRPYFDALDAELRVQHDLIIPLICTVPYNRPIALQGNFGLAILNLMKIHNLHRDGMVWLRSSPRLDEMPIYADAGVLERNPIFLDDSCYSGKTIEAVDALLQKDYGVNVHYTNVIYDGMKSRNTSVNSMFRYYDYF